MVNAISEMGDSNFNEWRERVTALRQSISRETADELKRGVAQSVNVIGMEMIAMAFRVARLREMGEDVSRVPCVSMLMKIDAGQVDASVVYRFSHWSGLLARVAALPMPEQVRLGAGELVPLVVLHKGEFDVRMVDLCDLSWEEVCQVINSQGELQSERQQIRYLERKLMKSGECRVPMRDVALKPREYKALAKAAGSDQKDIGKFVRKAILDALGLPDDPETE